MQGVAGEECCAGEARGTLEPSCGSSWTPVNLNFSLQVTGRQGMLRAEWEPGLWKDAWSLCRDGSEGKMLQARQSAT